MAYNFGSIVYLQTATVMLMSIRTPFKLLRETDLRKHAMEEMGATYLAYGFLTLADSRS